MEKGQLWHKHTYETHKTEMARLKEVVEHEKGTRSMFQDLTNKQMTLIPYGKLPLRVLQQQTRLVLGSKQLGTPFR